MPVHRQIPGTRWIFLIALTALVAFGFQGSRGLWETSEGRYAESAREMIEKGNYLEPTLSYRPHWTKPPLTYWAIAAGIKLLGPGETGVRLYNAVAFFLTTLLVALIGTTLWGGAAGWAAGLIYATSPFPVFGAFAVTTDTLLALWTTASVLCYLRARHSRESSGKWIIAMWASLGLGFFTKGPPSLLPLIPILLWHFQRKPRIRIAPPAGLFLFFLTGFSWYLVILYRHPDLLGYFFGHEIVDRVSSNAVHNPEWYMPFYIYLPVLIFGAGPWLYYGSRLFAEKRLFHPKVLWSYLRKGSEASFLLLWLLAPLLLFFLVKSRLSLYVLPLYPAVALALAGWIFRGGRDIRISRRISKTALYTALVLIALKGALSLYPYKNDMKRLYEACRRVADPAETEIFAFNRSKLYGLQYYLKGRLKRISPSGKEEWADFSLTDLPEAIRRIPSSCLLLSDRKQASNLSEALRALSIPFQRHDERYWALYRIGKTDTEGKSLQKGTPS